MPLSNERMNPIYMINDYVWALLQQQLGLEKVGTSVPITPADGPEYKEGNKPYLIYSFTEEGFTGITPLHSCVATYAVFAPRAREVNDIVQLLSMAMNREDTAMHIVNYANKSSRPSKPFAGMNVASVEVLGSQSAMPPIDEGGMTDGFITIRYRYVVPDGDYSIS